MKPRVLTLVRHYLPGYKSGGPVRTIANMVEHLGDEIEFCLVNADRDALDEIPYPGVVVDAWNAVGKAQVWYCSPLWRSAGMLARLINDTPHDVLYLNSFFDPVFAVRPLVDRLLGRLPSRPLILAPRGEFSPGALKLKRWKKEPYRWLARLSGICRDITWHASSAYETADIRRAIGAPAERVVVAPDLPPLPGSDALSGAATVVKGGPLRVTFLSRITPKKNLDFALRVLARLRVPAQFNIYGPVRSDGYWQRCQQLIGSLPSHVTAQYHGAVEPARIPAIMAEHDLFFLPTLGENYGHVIAEALAAGTPVLIADTTPWRGLEQLGVGWDLPLDSEEAFAERIELCAGLDSGEWWQWRASVQAYARRRLTDPQLVDANRRLFLHAVNGAYVQPA